MQTMCNQLHCCLPKIAKWLPKYLTSSSSLLRKKQAKNLKSATAKQSRGTLLDDLFLHHLNLFWIAIWMCLWQIHKVNRDRKTDRRKEKQELGEPANKHERFSELNIHSRQKKLCSAKWYLQPKTLFLLFPLKGYCISLCICEGRWGAGNQPKTKQNKTPLPFRNQTFLQEWFCVFHMSNRETEGEKKKTTKKTLTHLLSDPPHLQGAVQCLH